MVVPSENTVNNYNKHLALEINQKGYAVIPNFASITELQCMRNFVDDAVSKAGNQYVGFVGRDAVEGSAFAELGDRPSFQALLKQLYSAGTGEPGPKGDIYQVLRCLRGDTGIRHALIFHYDSYVVTALMPVYIPTE